MTTRAPSVRTLLRLTPFAVAAAASACSPAVSDKSAADTTPAKTGTFALTPEQRQRIHFETARVVAFRPMLEATGNVAFNGDRSTQVLSPVSGPAVRVLVNPGAQVTRGQPLALVSSPDFAEAVATYRKAQTAYRNAKRIADRDEQLFKNDALARSDLEQAQADVASADADVEAAVQQMHALGVEETQIAAIRDGKTSQPIDAIIRSPIDGTVVEKLVSEGQLLSAGATPVFTVADLSTMWVMANVFENDVADIAVGQPVQVFTDAVHQPLSGRVDYVAALVDPGTKAVSVRILTPNVGQVLRRDMFVRVAITSAHEHSGVLVPTSSVLRDDQNLPFVFVATADNSFARRHIDLGTRVGDKYAISSGLKTGDRVVAEGALFLQFAESQ